MFVKIMPDLAELEQKTENLFVKAVQTPIAALFGVIQSVNWHYERDITLFHPAKDRSYFDEIEISVHSKIQDTVIATLGIMYLTYDKIKNANHKK